MTEQVLVLKLGLRRKPYARPAYYKPDGDRFDTPNTVKLNVNSRYRVELAISPPRRLQALYIGGKKLDMVAETTKEQTIDNSRVYTGDWKTVPFCRNETGSRTNVDIRCKMEGRELTSKLQCKFYGDQEMAHSCWGNALDYVEYRCRLSLNMTSSIDVLQESFVDLQQNIQAL